MKFKVATILFAVLVLIPTLCFAKRIHPEKCYQDRWCSQNGGRAEVVLPDKIRCNCITADNAVEVEFANKWTKAIGQSLYYSLQTGKRAGIVLIVEDIKDQRFWIRLNSTILHFNLSVDTLEVKDQ